MKIAQLMEQLAAMYPNHFAKPENVDAWAGAFKYACREGPALGDAFQRCMGDWTKSTPPRPGDVNKYLESAVEEDDGAHRWSNGAMLDWVNEHLADKTAGIWRAAAERIGRCEGCKAAEDFPYACRCAGWHDAREIAFLWLQREWHIEGGRARVNLYPDTINDKQLAGLECLRKAPPMKPYRNGIGAALGKIKKEIKDGRSGDTG
jgi:hypothetical protein